MINRKIFAFLLTASVLTLSALEAWAAGSSKSGMAPLSPEFLKWRENQAKIRAAGNGTTAARNYGVRPSPLNLAHLAGNPVRVAAELPEKFDLRSWDVVPPLRNQSSWGTCWAFATVAAMETNYLLQINGRSTDGYITSAIDGIGTTPEEVDLSEMHLAWFSVMAPKMEQRFANDRAKDILNPTGNEALNTGAFPSVPMAVLSRGKNWGPVNESDLHYIGTAISFDAVAKELGFDPDDLTKAQIAEVEQEIEKRTNTYCETNLSGKMPNDYRSVLRLKEAAYAASVYMLDESNEGNTKKLFKDNQNAIKQLIMDKGALYISYKADGTINSNDAYYYTGSEGGHAVALIGWDDDYAVENFTEDDGNGNARPSNPGAWLIRNSWGEDNGRGYFWISYEQDIGFGTAFSMAPADSLTPYTHSDLGWCVDWGMGEGNKTFYGASVFKVGSNGGTLKEIGFYTTDNNASAEFSVYVYDEKPTASTLTSGQTAVRTVAAKTYPYAGYHTVSVPDLALDAGQYFSIVQKAVNPQYAYPIATMAKVDGWTDFAELYDGTGFVSENGADWFDGVQMKNGEESQFVTPCIIAFMEGTAEDDDGRDTDQTIDGVPVQDMDSFMRDINVSPDINEALNVNIPAGRKFTLTLGGTDGKPIAEGENFTIYLMYTEDVLYGESSESSKWGERMPSGDILPLYPIGYKPDLFLSYEFTDELDADFPVYGPFEVTTADGGKATIDIDKLTYADMGESEKVGEVAKIPAGHHMLLYFSPIDGGANGAVDGLNVTAATGRSSSSSSSGCNTLWGTGFALVLPGLAWLLRRKSR